MAPAVRLLFCPRHWRSVRAGRAGRGRQRGGWCIWTRRARRDAGSLRSATGSTMRPFLLVALALVASGCATLVRGPSAVVGVTADRDSAYVFVDGVAAGVAPARLEMARARDHRVEVVREGYLVARDSVERQFNPAVAAGSFLLSGPASLGLDVSSGAVYDLRPAGLRVRLVPDSAGVEADTVSHLIRRAQDAARDGFPRPAPVRRAPPWVTAQLASGLYVGGDPTREQGSTGGIGASLLLGVRGAGYSARLARRQAPASCLTTRSAGSSRRSSASSPSWTRGGCAWACRRGRAWGEGGRTGSAFSAPPSASRRCSRPASACPCSARPTCS